MRLDEIQSYDLNLFEFDRDTTFAVFFLSAEEQIYGRYGGRDSDSADSRISLAGLNYAMKAAVDNHRRSAELPSSDKRPEPLFIRDFAAARNRRSCMHCHEVKEVLDKQLQEDGASIRELLWRFPPPDNLGIELEVDRGNVVAKIEPESPAARAGLKKGDVVRQLNEMPVYSFADAQFALDRAPQKGKIEVSWVRDGTEIKATLPLKEGWRRTDVTWRPSMMHMIPSARLYGRDLNAEERATRGLKEKQLAFWQKYPVHKQARAAGVEENDIILGFDGEQLEMGAYDFLTFVRVNYVVGDKVIVNVLRGKKRLNLPMTLKPF